MSGKVLWPTTHCLCLALPQHHTASADCLAASSETILEDLENIWVWTRYMVTGEWLDTFNCGRMLICCAGLLHGNVGGHGWEVCGASRGEWEARTVSGLDVCHLSGQGGWAGAGWQWAGGCYQCYHHPLYYTRLPTTLTGHCGHWCWLLWCPPPTKYFSLLSPRYVSMLSMGHITLIVATELLAFGILAHANTS